MSHPLVSICMITYNHSLHIEKAIRGVMLQKTEFPIELVIGEDCSTDNTKEIIDKCIEKYPKKIKVITSEKNVGMIKNAYRTFKKCKGKYIAICEGDDYWHNEYKLQKQADYLKRNKNCALVCSDYDVFYSDTKKHISMWNKKKGKDPSKIKDIHKIIRGTPTSGIMTCTVMVRSELLIKVLDSDEYLFQNENQPCGDTPMWVEMSRVGQIGYINESLATYNRHPETATHNPDKSKVLKTSISMKKQMLYLVNKHNLSDNIKKIHEKDLYKRMLKLAFYEEDKKMAVEAKKYLKKLSFGEKLQYYGGINRFCKVLFKPIVETFYRKLIPASKW